jgi:hypothetical protein
MAAHRDNGGAADERAGMPRGAGRLLQIPGGIALFCSTASQAIALILSEFSMSAWILSGTFHNRGMQGWGYFL